MFWDNNFIGKTLRGTLCTLSVWQPINTKGCLMMDHSDYILWSIFNQTSCHKFHQSILVNGTHWFLSRMDMPFADSTGTFTIKNTHKNIDFGVWDGTLQWKDTVNQETKGVQTMKHDVLIINSEYGLQPMMVVTHSPQSDDSLTNSTSHHNVSISKAVWISTSSNKIQRTYFLNIQKVENWHTNCCMSIQWPVMPWCLKLQVRLTWEETGWQYWPWWDDWDSTG